MTAKSTATLSSAARPRLWPVCKKVGKSSLFRASRRINGYNARDSLLVRMCRVMLVLTHATGEAAMIISRGRVGAIRAFAATLLLFGATTGAMGQGGQPIPPPAYFALMPAFYAGA